MDAVLLGLLDPVRWQWVNMASCSLGSLCAGLLCLVALNPDGSRVVWTLRWASALLSVALGVVSIAEFEVMLNGHRPHAPTEVVLNVILAVFLTTLVWMRVNPKINDYLN